LVLFTAYAKVILERKLDVILAEIDALFPGELYEVDSTDENYSFLALHFGRYNKYSENVSVLSISAEIKYLTHHFKGPGEGGPRGVHVDDMGKEGVWKINFTQRAPRESLDLRDHPALIAKVKDILEDLMRFAHDNVS
jgi:hypothetical protein